jgi:hypothetical protein
LFFHVGTRRNPSGGQLQPAYLPAASFLAVLRRILISFLFLRRFFMELSFVFFSPGARLPVTGTLIRDLFPSAHTFTRSTARAVSDF